jgi:hypothetical protein
MQESENRSLFTEPKRAACETESHAVMNQAGRLPRGLQGLPKTGKAIERAHRREEIPAERCAAHSTFSRRLSSAEVIVHFKPAGDIELRRPLRR